MVLIIASWLERTQNLLLHIVEYFHYFHLPGNVTIQSESISSTPSNESSVVSQSTKSACKPVTVCGSWTGEECRDTIEKLFQSSETVHNTFLCSKTDCTNISLHEQQRLKPKKFQHTWLSKENWWLCYVESEGMFCLVCRKHAVKHPQNQKEVFGATPSVRMKGDAIKSHSKSILHAAALESEILQRASYFHKEITKQSDTQNEVLEQAFSSAYFLISSFVASRQFIPLLNHIEKVYHVDSLKYFNHRSRGAQHEIFLTLGQTMKTKVLSKMRAAAAFGILTDEVSDVSVSENLVTFIQYFCQETGCVETHFLACQNILESWESANSEAISALILEELEEHDGLNLSSFTGLTSDGASVMVGKRTGVAARLKKVNPVLLNVHCVCHRLALACTDSNQSLKYINNVETLLRQLWQYFENSPKRMAAYLKIQAELKSVRLEGKAVKRVTKRLKKACRTRWLSFEAAVRAVYEDYEAILQTLAYFQETDSAALGLLLKMKTFKFIGVIYILRDILSILGDLSRRFQKGSLSFAAIIPAVNMTKDRLRHLFSDAIPIEKLSQDIESFTEMSAEIKMNQKDAKELHSLFETYISALIENIDNRFTDSCPVLEAFNVFDPMLVPESGVEMKNYGQGQVEVLCNQYFKENTEGSDRLKAEWEGMKYHLRDVIRPSMPDSVKSGKDVSPTEWCLLQLLKNTAVRQLYPNVTYIAEVIISLPVSNAWPERGASTLKALKTRLRNRLSTPMLESLLHICINAPEPSSPEVQQIVKEAVNTWLEKKKRRKVPKQTVSTNQSAANATDIEVEDAGVQTDPYMDSEDVIQTAVDIALKKLNIEHDESEYSDSGSDWSDDEGCCSNKC